MINYFKRQKVVNKEIEELETEITKSKSKEEEYETQINNVEKTLKSLESEAPEVNKANKYLEQTYNFTIILMIILKSLRKAYLS